MQTTNKEIEARQIERLMSTKPTKPEKCYDTNWDKTLGHWEEKESDSQTQFVNDLETSGHKIPLNLSTKLSWVTDMPTELFGVPGLYTG